MATPEHAHPHEIPSCCQIAREREPELYSIQNIVGDGTPDGFGGSQRSTPDSPSACCSPTCQGTFVVDARRWRVLIL